MERKGFSAIPMLSEKLGRDCNGRGRQGSNAAPRGPDSSPAPLDPPASGCRRRCEEGRAGPTPRNPHAGASSLLEERDELRGAVRERLVGAQEGHSGCCGEAGKLVGSVIADGEGRVEVLARGRSQ